MRELVGGFSPSPSEVQEIVNEQDLPALRLHGELEEPLTAHLNQMASRRGERGHDPVGAAPTGVVPIDEVQSGQDVRGRFRGRFEVHRQRPTVLIGEVLEQMLAIGVRQAPNGADSAAATVILAAPLMKK